jgi:hypothetical protein
MLESIIEYIQGITLGTYKSWSTKEREDHVGFRDLIEYLGTSYSND